MPRKTHLHQTLQNHNSAMKSQPLHFQGSKNSQTTIDVHPSQKNENEK